MELQNDLYFSNSISNLENTPEAQPSLRTIRSLPQRRNKRPRLNHIESPPPPPESSSPTEASRSESPVTPPTRLLPFHSPRTKEAIATLTDSVAAFNIRRSSRKPMTSEIVRLASPLDLPDGSDHYSYGAPRLEIGSCLEEYENHQVGQLANGVDEEDEEDAEDAPEEDQQVEDEVDEADQDFSGYAFLSAGHPKQTSSTNQSSLADQPNANRKKRKVPSTVVIPLAHPVIQYGLEYELRPANVSSPYTLPHTMAHTTPAFGQLLRAAQLEGEGGEYDDAEEEEEDVSASTTPVDFTNPVTLAKALSSHHVKMMKKPISSPRHYGRQLHKLALSRLLIRSSPGPSSSSHLGSISTPDQSTKTPKKTKSPSLTARNNSASKRTPNRKTPLRPKPKAPLSKLKMPVLPNLYDPSLPLEVAYPTTVDPARLTKLRSHSNREQVEENHSPRFEVFPRPSSVDQSRRPSLTMPNHANESEDGSDGHSLRGEFSFRLEIAEINHRLVALHIAISDERKTREAQIKEAMKIAMEQQHDLRQHIRRSDTAKLSLGDAEGRSDQRSITVGKDSIKGETTPMKSSGLTSNNRRSKSHMSQRPLTSNVDHGPSGPPPSEPPPPLPSGPHTNSSSANLSLNNPNGRIPEPSPKKNGKKGKKKRSAHANANNIHHRDNYVPSRLPTTHQQTTTVAGQGVLGTELATMDLLAKDYDPTGTRSSLHPFIDPNLSVLREGDTETSPSANNGSHSQLGSSAIAKFFVEPDEWICGFCEYELWFGEELSLIKVIKNRKMILRRRKRAKERAARAAAGIKNPSNPGTGPTNSSGNNGLASSSSSGTNNNKNIVNPVHSNNPSIPPPPPPPPTSSPASP